MTAGLGDVLVLMCGARERFVPFAATVLERIDGADARRVDERFAASPEGQAEGWQQNVEARAARGDYRDYDATVRLWVEGPERMRTLVEAPGHAPAEYVRGSSERHWIDDWLDPARLLGSVAVEPRGERAIAGRPAFTLRARRRPEAGVGEGLTLFMLGRGADEYELDVDAELGMLVRTAALLDGREYLLREAVAIDREPL